MPVERQNRGRKKTLYTSACICTHDLNKWFLKPLYRAHVMTTIAFACHGRLAAPPWTGVNNVYIHLHWRTGSSTALHVPPRSSGGSTPPDALFSFIFHKWNLKNHLLYVNYIVNTYVFQTMPWMEYSLFHFSFLSAFVSSFSMTSKGPWKSPCWSLAPSPDQFWFCTRHYFPSDYRSIYLK